MFDVNQSISRMPMHIPIKGGFIFNQVDIRGKLFQLVMTAKGTLQNLVVFYSNKLFVQIKMLPSLS